MTVPPARSRRQLIVDIERYNSEIRSVTEEIAGSDAAVAVLNNDISHSRASIEQLRQEIDAAGRDDADAARQIEEHHRQTQEAECRIAAEDDRIADLTRRLEQLSASAQATGERRADRSQSCCGGS